VINRLCLLKDALDDYSDIFLEPLFRISLSQGAGCCREIDLDQNKLVNCKTRIQRGSTNHFEKVIQPCLRWERHQESCHATFAFILLP
jgi:hypothetical protein